MICSIVQRVMIKQNIRTVLIREIVLWNRLLSKKQKLRYAEL